MKNKKRFYPVEWMQKVSGVYQIKNKVNKKIYIGSSINIYQRWKQHICAFSNNRHNNIRLLSSWKKYGEESFEFSIVEEMILMQNEKKIDFAKRIKEKEQHYMDITNCCNSHVGYNISEKASGGDGQKITFNNFDEKEKLFTKEMNPIVERNKFKDDVIVYLGRSYITQEESSNAAYSLSGRNPNIFCKNGKKFDYLLNMDKEDAQKILNSKKENKVKIIGGTTYE